MKYEVVNLERKMVVGIGGKTGNADPNMGEVIGGLWKELYGDGVYGAILNKANGYAIGLYSDYVESGYCVTVGCEVTNPENVELVTKTIPAGQYAKFSVHGNMVTAVAKAWGDIWQMELSRTYTGDFEVYTNSDCENADVDIYVAIS